MKLQMVLLSIVCGIVGSSTAFGAMEKYFEFPGVSIMMIENQKISWDKDYWAWSAFLQAIGVVP